MKLSFKKDKQEEAIKILKAIASKNKDESIKAQEALAAFVGPVVSQVLSQTATSNSVYRTENYSIGDVPSIPLDLFVDNTEGLFTIWSQAVAGGLATNEVWGMDEYRFRTYRLDSAISFAKSYAEKSRLGVVAKAMERLAQEILVKQEYQAWNIICSALGESRTNGEAHVINSVAKAGSLARNFTLADLNSLWTKVTRLRRSWAGGTPTATPGRGLTDIFLSPEGIERIRAMAYNPVNTTAVPDTQESTALGLPDSMREAIYNNAGMGSIFGVTVHQLLELGVNQPYNTLFDNYYTAAGSDPTFAGGTNEVAIGFDLSVDSFIRVVATDSDTGSTFTLEPDDQFTRRQEKIGWYGSVEEGRLCADTKAVVGILW